MSYDVRFAVKVEGTGYYAVIGEPEYSSPTYNLRDMFVACMDWDYEQSKWYPMEEVLPHIRQGIRELIIHTKKYEKYNDPDGWGTTESALNALCSIYRWLIGYEGLRGSWNADIPIEHLYFSW